MNKAKYLLIGLIWLVIVGIGAVTWRWLVAPMRDEARQQAVEQAEREAIVLTEGELPYDHELALALDSFSGYAVLRSKVFERLLRQEKIKLELIDDGANYTERLNKLNAGKVQMAAFTIDALIKTTAKLGRSPATIVALIDETRGADAMVAYQDVVGNVDDLNHPETRFVVTADSPSETLARVVMNTFALDRLPADPFIRSGDAADVYKSYRESRKGTRSVFVLWEPYVSQVLANDAMHVVIDSSRFTGYIVDCLVADRDYFLKNREVIDTVVECYFRALYEYRDPEKLRQLVVADAGEASGIDEEISRRLVAGIDWKNTQENFAHFGLLGGSNSQHVADMIENITEVLINTGAIDSDPTGDQPNLLYNERSLKRLVDAGFHPGDEVEQIGQDAPLQPLNDRQWESLEPVGTLSVRPLVFARGSDRLDGRSQAILDDLVQQLKTWPQYYVLVRGNASRRGNLEANQRLAEARAKAAETYLTTHGVEPVRIRAVGVEPSGQTSVSFVLGQLPY